MAYETIRAEAIGPVLRITLNRPERLNACTPLMAREIGTALALATEARAVLLTGEGRAFCSGADLADSHDSDLPRGAAGHKILTESFHPLIARLARLPVPVVCAVNGIAAGIGCSIALTADFVMAGQSAAFLQAFVNVGLVPDGGASWVLPRLVGKARATEMMMLGERIPAERAENWGLIHKCVDDAVLQDEALALAMRLANGPTVALGIMRRNIARAMESDLASALEAEAEGQAIARDSEDGAEGVNAFVEKRPPAFKGR